MLIISDTRLLYDIYLFQYHTRIKRQQIPKATRSKCPTGGRPEEDPRAAGKAAGEKPRKAAGAAEPRKRQEPRNCSAPGHIPVGRPKPRAIGLRRPVGLRKPARKAAGAA